MKDIQELYEDAMTILNDPRGIDPELKDMIEGYFAGIRDVMLGHNSITVRFDSSSMNDIKSFIEEVWNRPEGIIEDEVSKLCFKLLCQKVIQVFDWNVSDREPDFDADDELNAIISKRII